ncbi:peptidase M14 [Alicycliphilus denitrificans]|uniref:Peptidase M14 n=1 Tax=Alicycliphilus denitrificans TaxID=179636 RepID=A0A3R7EXE2_9BURK|nr:peptidase M14 [Alicycliphilus denitrificans]RKJ94672.1 peptidase M14 [Alicycliphilus denitrificans]
MTAANAASTLLDLPLERTLHAWVRRFSQPRWHGRHVEGWLFEGRAERLAAERQLAAVGVHARFHSAYKPLVQHFIDHVDLEQLAAAHVRYPVPATGPQQRFLLEAYPLAALLGEDALRLEPRGDADPWYDVQLHLRDGQCLEQRVRAPNRAHADTTGTAALSPCGWLRAGTQAGAADLLDIAVCTDFERAFHHAVQAVREHPWPPGEPYFERLLLRIDLPGFEQAIAWAGETISTAEALHEDLYFSLLEFFQQHSGRPVGDRRLQPGQIVPDVRTGAAAPRVHVSLQPFDAAAQDALAAREGLRAAAGQPLESLDRAPAPERIAQVLQSWPGRRFSAPTRQGRTVWGLYHPGTQRPVFISGGQHANETSGVVGALRAAEALRRQDGAHFALIALENPDGYALHGELCALHAGHMHHAARYTALGDDVEYRETAPLLEREARQAALSLSGAQLHVNLHGYPAHEWTRPLSGYVPRGFEQWMCPKGFFLILRHHAGWQQPARALLEAVCARLAQVPGLAEFNARQRALYERHAGPLPFEVLHGIACMQTQTAHDAPVTLVTEFPDETVCGDAFRFAHTVQMHTALAAVQAWQRIAPR